MSDSYYAIPWDNGPPLFWYRVLLCERGVWLISDCVYNDKDRAITEAIAYGQWSRVNRTGDGWHIFHDWGTYTTGPNFDAISKCIVSHELEATLLSDDNKE